MTLINRPASPDILIRNVLFAVELLDPISQELVWRDVEVRAAGVTGAPIVNRSGRFVWLEERDAWPQLITVTPKGVPFAPHIAAVPDQPAPGQDIRPSDRLARITLRPTPAYAFDQGVTAVRGRLTESDAKDSPPIVGARVQLAWFDQKNNQWIPRPPAAEKVDENDRDLPSPAEVETDGHGQFAAFLRLAPLKGTDPDLKQGLLAVRLQLTRGRRQPVTRATRTDFDFLESANPDNKGRVREGELLNRDLRLAWNKLDPI